MEAKLGFEPRQTELDALRAGLDLRAVADSLRVDIHLDDDPRPLPKTERDAALLDRMRGAANGDRFDALWKGDAETIRVQYGNHRDHAILSLCTHLAFWTQNHAKWIDRLFRQSGLYKLKQGKWDEPRSGYGTWGWKTIAAAIAFNTAHRGAVADGHGESSSAGEQAQGGDAAPGPAPAIDRPPLRYQTARELMRAAGEVVEWEVQGFAARGAVTELDGKVKIAGKTTFLLAMVRAKVDGLPFLNRPTRRGPVVILTEQSAQTFKTALRRAELHDRDDVIVLLWRDAARWSWQAIVRETVAECKQRNAHLLIVDTTGQFTGVVGDQENAAGRALEAMMPLQHAAASEDLAIVSARHERKSGGAVGESGRGSSAYAGSVDIILSLRLPEGQHPGRPRLRELHGIGRFDETPERLLIEWGGGADYVAHGAAADVERQETQKALLAALPRSQAKAKTVRELILSTGRKMTRTIVYGVLEKWADEKIVGRAGTGKRGHPYRYWLDESRRGRNAETTVLQGVDESAGRRFWDSSRTPRGVVDESSSGFVHNTQSQGDAVLDESIRGPHVRGPTIEAAFRAALLPGAAEVPHHALYTRLRDLTGMSNADAGRAIAGALAVGRLVRVRPRVYRLGEVSE
jgi:hypothetical protein